MSPNEWLWLLAYLAFGPTLYVPARAAFPLWLQLARLSVATLAPLLMVYVDPHSFACTLWVIAAWELAIALPLSIMLPWTVLLSLAMTALLARGLPTRYAFQEMAIFCAFQGYAIITAYVARSETLLRREGSRARTRNCAPPRACWPTASAAASGCGSRASCTISSAITSRR